jgi:hypothetical protein
MIYNNFRNFYFLCTTDNSNIGSQHTFINLKEKHYQILCHCYEKYDVIIMSYIYDVLICRLILKYLDRTAQIIALNLLWIWWLIQAVQLKEWDLDNGSIRHVHSLDIVSTYSVCTVGTQRMHWRYTAYVL